MQTAQKYTHDVTAHREHSHGGMAPQQDAFSDTHRGREVASYVGQLLAQKRSALPPTFDGHDGCNWATD